MAEPANNIVPFSTAASHVRDARAPGSVCLSIQEKSFLSRETEGQTDSRARACGFLDAIGVEEPDALIAGLPIDTVLRVARRLYGMYRRGRLEHVKDPEGYFEVCLQRQLRGWKQPIPESVDLNTMPEPDSGDGGDEFYRRYLERQRQRGNR